MQHHPTSCNRVFKRCNMLHATMLDDVACNMLRSFERAFKCDMLASAPWSGRLVFTTSHQPMRKRETAELWLKTTFPISTPGGLCHYFSLAVSFWAMCFVVNTYQVIVRNNKAIFKRPGLFHLLQSGLCWVAPAITVVICLLLGPGYKFLFVDFLVAVPGSMAMTYYAFTLPLQVSLGISLCLLWSIVWCLRTVSGLLHVATRRSSVFLGYLREISFVKALPRSSHMNRSGIFVLTPKRY